MVFESLSEREPRSEAAAAETDQTRIHFVMLCTHDVELLLIQLGLLRNGCSSRLETLGR